MKSAAHQYEDKLLEFAYGELPPHEASAVETHVQGCTRCGEMLAEIRGVRATMAQLPMEQAPDAGLDSLLAYAEQAAKRNATVTAPPSLWKRLLMPLASVAALATVGVVSFRANQELDLSPASAVADQKVEELRKQEGKKVEGSDSYAASEPLAQPVAAAEPAKNQLEGGEFEAQGTAEADRREWGGKRGSAEAPVASKPAPKLESLSKRAKQKPAAEPQRLEDYANARGGLAPLATKGDVAPPAPPVQQAPMDKVGTFGLGSGPGVGSGLGSGGGRSEALAAKPSVPAEEKSKDAVSSAVKEAPMAPPPPKTAAPAPTASSTMPSKKSSYGLRPLGGSSSAPSADDESAALERVDGMGLDRDAKFSERQRAESRTRSLEGARAASSRGDRATEIRLAAEALSSGAVGAERVEALKRLCDGWEALGQPERADAFCDQLLSEFPTSTAARAVEERRGRMQRASPAKTTSDDVAPSRQ